MLSPIQALADLLAGRDPVFAAWCGLPEPSVAGHLAREADVGAVVLDMQHGSFDYMAAASAISHVVAAGKPAIPRIPVGDFAVASRLLDAGAAGIIAPMINSAEDARLLVGCAKYPPLGERSWGPVGAMTLSGLGASDYFRGANGFLRAFAMIETRDALDGVDAILAVDGIDGLFIGPFDLSIGLSGGSVLDPDGREVGAAIDHALARARAAGKAAGIYAADGARGADYARRGYDLVAVGSDLAFLKAGAAAMLGAATARR